MTHRRPRRETRSLATNSTELLTDGWFICEAFGPPYPPWCLLPPDDGRRRRRCVERNLEQNARPLSRMAASRRRNNGHRRTGQKSCAVLILYRCRLRSQPCTNLQLLRRWFTDFKTRGVECSLSKLKLRSRMNHAFARRWEM